MLSKWPLGPGRYAAIGDGKNQNDGGIKLLWKKALVVYLIGAVVLGGLIFNTAFYMQVETGILQAVAILWFYGIIFWLTMQMYLMPLLVAAVRHGVAECLPDTQGRVLLPSVVRYMESQRRQVGFDALSRRRHDAGRGLGRDREEHGSRQP